MEKERSLKESKEKIERNLQRLRTISEEVSTSKNFGKLRKHLTTQEINFTKDPKVYEPSDS